MCQNVKSCMWQLCALATTQVGPLSHSSNQYCFIARTHFTSILLPTQLHKSSYKPCFILGMYHKVNKNVKYHSDWDFIRLLECMFSGIGTDDGELAPSIFYKIWGPLGCVDGHVLDRCDVMLCCMVNSCPEDACIGLLWTSVIVYRSTCFSYFLNLWSSILISFKYCSQYSFGLN